MAAAGRSNAASRMKATLKRRKEAAAAAAAGGSSSAQRPAQNESDSDSGSQDEQVHAG